MVCEQATRRGGFGQVTDSLYLITLFQGLYVADALYNEVCNAARRFSSAHADRRSRVFLPRWT
jgi:hypothetical protein